MARITGRHGHEAVVESIRRHWCWLILEVQRPWDTGQVSHIGTAGQAILVLVLLLLLLGVLGQWSGESLGRDAGVDGRLLPRGFSEFPR